MEKLKCPGCGGCMAPKNNGQRVGSIVGGTVGVLARLGTIIGNPIATLTALLAGALTGQKLGQIIDGTVIRSYRCTTCGKEISL